ncbi:MAG: hypothetical protein SXA11_17840 [Cyanobacteriota bacterium]|nr:hypothetical protein [Cyanobacteriota bacterium]
MMKHLKNVRLPSWFPYPSSWLKAVILAWLVTGIAFTTDRMAIVDYSLAKFGENRELLVVFSLGILLVFIPAIALFHYLLHLFFHCFIPEFILPTLRRTWRVIKKRSFSQYKATLKNTKKHGRSPEINNYSTGILPTLINWWAGLYTWLVFILSTIIAVTVYTLLLSWFDLSYETISLNYNQIWETKNFYQFSLWLSFALIWITAAAILYHIEHLFKLKLIVEIPIFDTSNIEAENMVIANNNYEDIDWNNLPVRVQINNSKKGRKSANKTSTIDIHIKLPESQVLSGKNGRKRAKASIQYGGKLSSGNWGRWRTLLAVFTISVLAAGIYGLYLNSKKADVTAEVSSPGSSQVSSAIASPVTPKPSVQPSPLPSGTAVLAPPDPFKMAVNRASNAAEMTQTASSRIEWEAVASQWQDAVELMKVVPAFHPNYAVARQKAIEYQYNANYARRVAANSRE